MLDLEQHQQAIFQQMREDAEARQLKDNASAQRRNLMGESKVGRSLVRRLTPLIFGSINEFLTSENKVGRQAVARKLLNDTGLHSKVVTWLTVKAIVNRIGLAKKPVKRVTLCRAIGDILHDEWRVSYFSQDTNRKRLLRKLMKDFDKRAYPREWRKRTIKNYFDAHMLDWEGWNTRQKIHVGYALLCLFKQETGLLEEVDKGTAFAATDTLIAAVEEMLKKQAASFIHHRPMVVPPKPWTAYTLFSGGVIKPRLIYGRSRDRGMEVKPYGVVKGFGKRDLERLDNFDWDRILPPLDALQQTPWRVNREVLEALEWTYYNHGDDVGKLVRCDPIPIPPTPHDYETDPEVKKRHNHQVFLIHDRNRQDKSRRIAAIMTMNLAKQFSQYEAIYFPHNLDSRGRAYPLPAFLNPQGPDYAKALLEFSRGEPIETEEQLKWLAVSGANAYGNDKVSLEERYQWVLEKEEMILSVANDYRTDSTWMHCSEPFQFLRFCLEWAGFKREGYGYVSHMVVPVDATCSGLQHYAAMLRDEVGGKSVNLVPGLSRQDIYGDVASVVIRKLKLDGSPVANDWITFGIDRKITKRQVMVVPYAGKFSSCMAYTKEAVAEKLASGVLAPWDIHDEKDHHERQVFLARLIWQAIDEVVVKGKEAMQWLSKLASEYSKWANTLTEQEGYSKRMTWVTPDGFEVAHYEDEFKRSQMNTKFDGRVQMVLDEPTGKLSVKDMALSIAPNFVHSLDATHLRLTIAKGLRQGIKDYGMVHDSFGVHAAKMPQFISECVKPAFVEMYEENDVLKLLSNRYDSVILPPPLPSKGTLDLRGVLRSEFFFS